MPAKPTKPEVSVLGPLGTYTHEAAFKYFGTEAIYREEKTIADVFRALDNTDFGVIPQENTIFGSVVETYDSLRSPDSGYVCGEVILAVQHCLLVRKGMRLEQIECVMSHEQALGQCGTFLKEHLPRAILVKTTSTASAAQAILSDKSNCAAIGSKICATLFDGLEVLYEGIQNEKSNFTRFYVVKEGTKSRPFKPPCDNKRALLRAVNLPTTSSGIFTIIGKQNLSITRIDRRPGWNTEPFRDVYFFEVEEGESKTDRDEIWLEKLRNVTTSIECAGGKADIAGLW